MESVDGATDVPAEESDSPAADTPGLTALGPTLVAVADAAVLPEVAVGESPPVEAGAVPVGVGRGDAEVAGAVPVGVTMSEVALVDVVAAEVELVEPDAGADAPM